MIKLVIINHTFQKKEFYKRWEILAERHKDLDITLLAPSEWVWGAEKNLTYGSQDTLKGVVVEKERFRIHLIEIKKRSFDDWTSTVMEQEILAIRPDVVYFIGVHNQTPLMELLNLKRDKRLKDTKFIAFSMRGHQQSLKLSLKGKGIKSTVKSIGRYAMFSRRLYLLNKYCDAILCHYPEAMSEFRREGYKKPIYMQTQVGVDPDIFHPDPQARIKIRNKYNIGNSFLFGSASRFNENKGLSQIISALPTDGDWKYLMMGWGRYDEVKKIKKEIKERGLENKIIMTGFIDNWNDMSEHWNALDCALHCPLTSIGWEETFSLALVQAMAVGLPVIGSSSGSVPYQIGPDGIIVPEGNVQALHDKMCEILNNHDIGIKIGQKMYERAVGSFSIYHLVEMFYHTILDVINDVYDEKKVDMTNWRES